MTDFKIMFPSMDADVIEAVLRANGGAVDATIDNLLTMSADAEATASQQVSIVEAMQKLHPVAGAASLQENTELLFEVKKGLFKISLNFLFCWHAIQPVFLPSIVPFRGKRVVYCCYINL